MQKHAVLMGAHTIPTSVGHILVFSQSLSLLAAEKISNLVG